MSKTHNPAAPPAVGAAVADVQHQDAKPAVTKTYLTAYATEAFGAHGRFVDLTADQAAAQPEGLLAEPTAEQLAMRRY